MQVTKCLPYMQANPGHVKSVIGLHCVHMIKLLVYLLWRDIIYDFNYLFSYRMFIIFR
jgi:hypothetical protein